MKIKDYPEKHDYIQYLCPVSLDQPTLSPSPSHLCEETVLHDVKWYQRDFCLLVSYCIWTVKKFSQDISEKWMEWDDSFLSNLQSQLRQALLLSWCCQWNGTPLLRRSYHSHPLLFSLACLLCCFLTQNFTNPFFQLLQEIVKYISCFLLGP